MICGYVRCRGVTRWGRKRKRERRCCDLRMESSKRRDKEDVWTERGMLFTGSREYRYAWRGPWHMENNNEGQEREKEKSGDDERLTHRSVRAYGKERDTHRRSVKMRTGSTFVPYRLFCSFFFLFFFKHVRQRKHKKTSLVSWTPVRHVDAILVRESVKEVYF